MSVLEGVMMPKISYEASLLSEGSEKLVLKGITVPKLLYESSFDGYVPSAAFPGPRASKGRLEVKVWADPIFGDGMCVVVCGWGVCG